MSGSSSEDESQEIDTTPLTINWLDLSDYNCQSQLGITSLPGCRFKDTWRSLKADIDHLQSQDIEDVYSLVTKGELNKYRVPWLLRDMAATETLHVHHYSFPDGQTPAVGMLLKMLEEMKTGLQQGRKTLLHCYGGLGRSCLVAVCLLLQLDKDLKEEDAIKKLKDLRGPGAIQSVKQFNFVNEFRGAASEFMKNSEDQQLRTVSR